MAANNNNDKEKIVEGVVIEGISVKGDPEMRLPDYIYRNLLRRAANLSLAKTSIIIMIAICYVIY